MVKRVPSTLTLPLAIAGDAATRPTKLAPTNSDFAKCMLASSNRWLLGYLFFGNDIRGRGRGWDRQRTDYSPDDGEPARKIFRDRTRP